MFGQVVVITAFVRNPSHEPLQACALEQVKPLHTATLEAGWMGKGCSFNPCWANAFILYVTVMVCFDYLYICTLQSLLIMGFVWHLCSHMHCHLHGYSTAHGWVKAQLC